MPMEEDEEEFGDLYIDVLRSISAPADPPPPSPTLPARIAPASRNSAPIPPSEAIPKSTPVRSNQKHPVQVQNPDQRVAAEGKDSVLGPAPITEEKRQPSDSNEDEEIASLTRDSRPPVSRDAGVEEKGGGLCVKDADEEEVKLEVEDEIGGFDEGTVIPGLSVEPLADETAGGGFGGGAAVEGDDWDSDSGDDLQIVLNDDGIDHRGGGIRNERVEGDEDDLVIVADEGQLHHHHQAMEELDWGEEAQSAADGDKKDASEAAKGSAGVGSASGRASLGSHGFHSQHQSQFKYVRPGVAPASGGATNVVGGPSQIRPFPMGSIAGRGRGLQRAFHPGYGLPNWANSSSARAFGSGLEFTLPSHKTIFDVDIDSFEEKPWKHVGVDVSDFFNFELDEDGWKEYCKQLEQLRLESTMQSKIRVYESGRSEQDFDPDLPPELAAASGLQDTSTENSQAGKVEGGKPDLLVQGRGTAWMRPQLPTGRAIQVETGTAERLPTIDTRHPRYRESDAIIEIVPQGPLDESEQQENGILENECMEGYGGKERRECNDPKYYDQSPKHKGKREAVTRGLHSVLNDVPEKDGILPLPPEIKASYYPCSKLRSPSSPGKGSGRCSGRQTPEKQQDRHFDSSDEFTNDVVSNQSTQIERNRQKQKSDDTGEANKTSEIQAAASHAEKEPSIENIESEHGDKLDFADSTEREDVASDSPHTGDTHGDSGSSYPFKKQKLSSQLEQPADLNSSGGVTLRTIISNNTREKSECNNDYTNHAEGCEVENIRDPRNGSFRDVRQHPNSGKRGFQQRDEYGRASRHELDQSCVSRKGKDNLLHPLVQQGLDTNMTRHMLEGGSSEKPKERNPGSFWQKRDAQVQGRKVKDGDLLPHKEETGSRHRHKLRPNEKKGGEDVQIRKQSEDGYWRGRHDREVCPQKMVDGEILMSRRKNLDDTHSNRRKDGEYHRKEKVTKEILPGHRSRDDSGQSKKERADNADTRRKETVGRARDKTIVDNHFSGHRDERRHRERDDRQRPKLAREDVCGPHERGGGSVARDFITSENKPYGDSERAKDGSKGLNSDSIVRGKRNEQSKRGGLIETHSRHKSHQESHVRESQISSEMKNYKYGRPSSHNTHSSNSGRQFKREKHRNNMRSNESEAKQSSLAPSKRKNEDNSVYKTEKVNKNLPSDEGMKSTSGRDSTVLKEQCHVDQKPEATREEKTATDDESQQELRRGRPKLERWTSHIERECTSTISQTGFDSSKNMEVNDNDMDATKIIVQKPSYLDNKDANMGQISDSVESDRHLDTVAKLKKRSERFKLPMLVEDPAVIKKVENEVAVIQGDSIAAESEIKQERPARKRRWGSS